MLSAYTILVTLHIVFIATWFGGSIAVHVFGRVAAASGDRQRMLQFSRDAQAIGNKVFAPAAVLTLLTGIFLVGESGAEFSDLWVTLAFVGWIVLLGIGAGYYSRASSKQEAIVNGAGVDSDEFLAQYRQVATVSSIELLIILLVVADMVMKPT